MSSVLRHYTGYSPSICGPQVSLSLVVFTHVSPWGPGLPRYNLLGALDGLLQAQLLCRKALCCFWSQHFSLFREFNGYFGLSTVSFIFPHFPPRNPG
jgi:hypothetical protein